ncbi:hypothetical protein MPTK1_3g14670 [Marchantia polymorpha subsp. ruderalis]|uniref:Uncharacterized protein n=2 Tax=Marchantia polymorpha TaxID=3197 RepID=A0AAF6B0U5_MARPO|nr:hypothetical protein MARPO_0004s0204 [Marchantia polymorpha]BBN05629.1 hypothetical protein Mp_3g14670 [Marchantia polymorpha subsp. ruderalis]|eukprot:PTQ48952.1 hypothetical protein MARPO_0004s0204 [Marchantia polymorpha]
MPQYGWKPEFNLPPLKKKREWPPPPEIVPHRTLKKSQLTKKAVPLKPVNPSEDEQRIIYEREIYRLYSLHAAPEELLKQYERYKDEKVSPGMVRAWLMNSYQGNTDEDLMPDGEGSADMAGGVHYKGMFKNGLLHGPGRLEWDNGSSFEGNFYYNRLLGKGVYSWVGGANYTGQIFDGLPHGQGKIEGPGGLVYQGRWDKGRRSGPGRMIYGTVATHEGTWKNDRKDGDGCLVYTSGSSYVGTWLDGKRHGKGKQIERIIPSKEKGGKGALASHILAVEGRPDTVFSHCYEGEWLRGLPHGRGRSDWPWDGKQKDASILINSYVGDYNQGMRHGKGTFFYASGALFKGNWQENMKVGLGVIVCETGKVHFGVFSHDRYDPVSKPGFDMPEPLVSTVKYLKEEDIEVAKHGILRTIMRYKNDLQDAFLYYCSLKEFSPPKKPVAKAVEAESEPLKDDGKKKKGAKKGKEGKAASEASEEGKAGKDTSKEEAPKDNSKAKEKPAKKGQKGAKEEKKGKKGGKVDTPKKEPEVEEPPFEPAKVIQPEPESPRQGIAGRSRGLANRQFWRLLQDALVLQPGLGLADVDRMLPLNDLSWDSVSDAHSPTRQLILREVVVALVQVALFKFQHEAISSEEKVERLFASMFHSLASMSYDTWLYKVDSVPVRAVLSENTVVIQKLFCELLLESETSDYTISLGSVIKYGQGCRPGHDVPPGALLAKVLLELYNYRMKPDSSLGQCLKHNVTYKEFETILLLFSSLGENLKPAGQEGAMEELADLLKAFLAGSAGKGSKGGPGVPQAKGAKAEPKKVKKRKDNPEWVK